MCLVLAAFEPARSCIGPPFLDEEAAERLCSSPNAVQIRSRSASKDGLQTDIFFAAPRSVRSFVAQSKNVFPDLSKTELEIENALLRDSIATLSFCT